MRKSWVDVGSILRRVCQMPKHLNSLNPLLGKGVTHPLEWL